MNDQSQQAEAVFLAALDKATPEERVAFADGACAGKPELRARVLELLASHEESRGPLDAPPAPVTLDAPDRERHSLRAEPVAVGPPSARNRLWSFARQHPGVTAAASAIVGIVLTAITLFSVFDFRPSNEKKPVAEGSASENQPSRIDNPGSSPSVAADPLEVVFDDLRRALEQGDLTRAAELLEQARAKERAALKGDPPAWPRRPNLTAAYQDYAERLLKLERYGELAEVAIERSRLFQDGWRECHWAADYLLRSTHMAFADQKLSATERMAISQKCQGVRDLLREAIQRGAKVFPDVLEAELLGITGGGGAGGSSTVQWMKPWGAERWSNGYQLLCKTAKGGYLVLGAPVPAAGDYRLGVHFTNASNFGIVEVSVDDQKVGQPFDGYDTQVRPSGEIDFGAVTLKQGLHHIRFTVVDKNPKASAYSMGIDCLTFKKVGGNKAP